MMLLPPTRQSKLHTGMTYKRVTQHDAPSCFFAWTTITTWDLKLRIFDGMFAKILLRNNYLIPQTHRFTFA